MLSIYDRTTRQKIAVLENCINAVELEKLNGVSELSFSLPLDDPKNEKCLPFHITRWSDGQAYRLLDTDDETTNDTGLETYSSEHVIATLIDDVIFGTLQLDNLTTRQVIEKLLSLQTTRNWVLGDCDFTRYFSYNWSNENLLVALFSIPNRFDLEYKWIFDTSVYPWRLHLKLLDQTINPEFYIRDGRNLLSSNIHRKGREICTRLYALGYGEGVNQLTFASVNNGKPYIDADSTAIAKYGLITRIWEDLRFEDPQALLDRARVLLDGYSKPYESYIIDVADLEEATGAKLDKAEAGKIVQFDDYKTYITQVERHLQEIGLNVLELANAPEDIAGSIADLADRQRINSVYAQGATCLYAQGFNDNADPTHPAVLRFYVPTEARQINKVILSWYFESFRAYSIGAESTTTTSRSTSSGGRTTRTSSSTTTTQSTSSSTTTSRATSSSGGDEETTSDSSSKSTTQQAEEHVMQYILSGEQLDSDGGSSMSPSNVSKKDHAHRTEIEIWFNHSHGMSHTHDVSIPSHTHDVDIPGHSHTVSIPGHNHTVDIPDHTHSVDIPGHTHATIYGIYEGTSASDAQLYVDGKIISLSVNQREIDISSLLSTDSGSGKISRGVWHRVEIYPNALTRIVANLSVQLFIQSEGGGLY